MEKLLTYIATGATSGTLRSVDEARRVIKAFGHLCIPIHYAATRHASHAAAYEIARQAYELEAVKPPVVCLKLFDKNVTEMPIIGTWTPDTMLSDLTVYGSYLERCFRIIEEYFGSPQAILIDHPDSERLNGPWAYGQSPYRDARIDACFLESLFGLTLKSCRVFAYGYPFHRGVNDRCWLEGEATRHINPCHTTYTKADPQPTIEQQKERFTALHRSDGRAMFFTLGASPHTPTEQALLHLGDANARNTDVMILYPQPGDEEPNGNGKGCTPWRLVDQYKAAMDGGQ